MAEEDENEQLERYIRKIAKDEAARSGGGGSSGGGVDLGDFGKFVHAAKDMKDAMTSDVDKALSTAVSTKIVDQVIPSMSPQPRASAGFWDTNSGVALMNKLGDQATAVLDMVFNRIGNDRVGKLADGIADTFLGGNKTSEDNMLSSLDPDNPADMHKYMALRNLPDPNIARKTLVEEKQKSMQRLRAGGDGAGGGGNGGVGTDFAQALETQNAMLREMLKARQEDRSALVQIWQSMEEMKKEQAKIKAGMVSSGESGGNSGSSSGGFNIDAIKDRGNETVENKDFGGKVEKSKVESVNIEKKSGEKRSEERSIDVVEVPVDSEDSSKEIKVEEKEEEKQEEKSVDEEVEEKDVTEKAVVNKKKGTPKWKDE